MQNAGISENAANLGRPEGSFGDFGVFPRTPGGYLHMPGGLMVIKHGIPPKAAQTKRNFDPLRAVDLNSPMAITTWRNMRGTRSNKRGIKQENVHGNDGGWQNFVKGSTRSVFRQTVGREHNVQLKINSISVTAGTMC